MGYLATLFGGTARVPANVGAGARGLVVDKTPTAPWSSTTKTEPNALVRSALGGQRFIDLRAPVIDAKGAAEDYRRLFALHQGLSMLDALAARADNKAVTALETTRLERAFQSGIKEINTFLGSDPFESIRIARTASGASAKTTVGPAKAAYTYVTPALHKGQLSGAVEALSGDVRFSLTVSRLTGDTRIDFDLSEMGGTERTMGQVTAYLNGKLAAAGVETRFSVDVIPGEPKTLKVGNRTLTLPSDSDSYALAVKAISTESLNFSAADRSDAVFVAQVSGKAGRLDLAKFQSDTGQVGAGAPAVPADQGEMSVQDRARLVAMSAGLEEVGAVRTGADGSVYVLGEATATVDGQTLKGARDVVLQKYDPAGQVVFTRTLGAAGEATAGDLAVAADGRIAVVGSVTGALDTGRAGANAAKSDSFITVFDSQGSELWTGRRGARAEDEATSVAFGADGSIYVGGRTRSGMFGNASSGGWDGYLQTYSSAGLFLGAQQFGTAGDDAAERIAVDGSRLIVAGTDSGRTVLRSYDLTDPTAPVPTTTRDLGTLQGEITSLAIDAGRVILAGSTRNSALGEGVASNVHSGGQDAFVMRLDASLAADGADRIAYLGGTGDDTAVSAAILDGKVWLTGQMSVVGEGASQTAKGRLMRVDADSGQIEWERSFQGRDGRIRPMAVAVAAGGASVLDRLGLPSGAIDFKPSQTLVDATSVRAGDQFMLDLGSGRLRTVTIEATDTYESLARKIASASQNRLEAKILATDGVQGLRVTLKPNRAPVEIVAGSLGRDALEALGLAQTLVTPTNGLADERAVFALRMASDLSLSSKAGIKAARDSVQAARLQLMSVYRKLTALDNPQAAALANPTYSEYQSKQMANYQAALRKLGGG
ncbi:MAG: transcriptional regulator [Caulobacterales bacterium]|nr:transcriptional regulator [Caulobacterales bacterium]